MLRSRGLLCDGLLFVVFVVVLTWRFNREQSSAARNHNKQRGDVPATGSGDATGATPGMTGSCMATTLPFQSRQTASTVKHGPQNGGLVPKRLRSSLVGQGLGRSFSLRTRASTAQCRLGSSQLVSLHLTESTLT